MAGEGDAERLIVLLEARVTDMERNMQRAAGTAERSYDRMRRGSRSATRQMEQDIIRSTNRINHALAGVSTKIGSYGKAFVGGFMGGMFVGGLDGMVRGVRAVTSEMTKLADVADKVGLSTTHLQQLRHVASLAGVEANNLDTAMQRFSRRVAEAASGGGVLHDVLKANNVQLRNADGSMRSQRDILRDYAKLIKNAGSEQERLLLAFKAFDSEGAALVNLFKDGSDAIDTMAQKTEEAGGVIDEQLIERARELDAKWTSTWRNFEVNAKSAILTAITWMDRLYEKSQEIGNSGLFRGITEGMAGLGLLDSDLTIHDPDLGRAAGRELGPDARIRDAFKTGAEGALSEADAALIEALQKRYGKAADKATIIPTKPEKTGSRNAAAEKALREAEAVKKLIDNLSEELRLVGASDLEKAKSNALRRAGAAATGEQRDQIEALVTAIYEETEAHKAAQEAAEARKEALTNLFEMAGDGLLSVVDGSTKAEDAIKKLAVQLALAAAQAALLGSGPLAGLFSGGIGSLFGAAAPDPWAGLRIPGFAKGTNFAPGGLSLVGERGPELVDLPRGARVIPNHRIGAAAGSQVQQTVRFEMSVNVSGNSDKELMNRMQQATEIQMQQALDNFSRHALPLRVNEISADPRARG